MSRGWRAYALLVLYVVLLAVGGTSVASATTPTSESARSPYRPRPVWRAAPSGTVDNFGRATGLFNCNSQVVRAVCSKARTGAPGGLHEVSFRLAPGQRASVGLTLETTIDVKGPKVVMQSAGADRMLSIALADEAELPSVLTAGEKLNLIVSIEVPPGARALRASGRVYLADAGSVLSPPINIRATIVQPTADELAATPVIIPVNNVRLVRDRWTIRERGPYLVQRTGAGFNVSRRTGPPAKPGDPPPSDRVTICDTGEVSRSLGGDIYRCEPDSFTMSTGATISGFIVQRDGDEYTLRERSHPDRAAFTCRNGQVLASPLARVEFSCDRSHFSVPDLVVTVGTNVTWTNTDSKPHSVQGIRCPNPGDRSVPASGQLPCGITPQLETNCRFAPGRPGEVFKVEDRPDGILCFATGGLTPNAASSLRFTLPVGDRQITTRYYVRDRLGSAEMKGFITVR